MILPDIGPLTVSIVMGRMKMILPRVASERKPAVDKDRAILVKASKLVGEMIKGVEGQLEILDFIKAGKPVTAAMGLEYARQYDWAANSLPGEALCLFPGQRALSRKEMEELLKNLQANSGTLAQLMENAEVEPMALEALLDFSRRLEKHLDGLWHSQHEGRRSPVSYFAAGAVA